MEGHGQDGNIKARKWIGVAVVAVVLISVAAVVTRKPEAQKATSYPKGSMVGKNLWLVQPPEWEATIEAPDKQEKETGESGAIVMHPPGSKEWFVVFDGIFLDRGTVAAAKVAVEGWRRRATDGGDFTMGQVKEERIQDRTLVYIEYREASLDPKGVQRDGVIVLPDGSAVRFNEGLLPSGSLVGPQTQTIVKGISLVGR